MIESDPLKGAPPTCLSVVFLCESSSQRREVVLDYVANDVYIHTEILMNDDVPKASDLRPADFWVAFCDTCGQMLCCFTNYLKVALNRVFCHFEKVYIATVQSLRVPLAPLDGTENVGNALVDASAHRATASASAVVEMGSLSSCAGKMSISSRSKRLRVSSISPDARNSRLPSAGSISTTMSISLFASAVPRATDPKSLGLLAAYFVKIASNSSRRSSRSARKARELGVSAIAGMIQ